jgi:hypothetical protein
VGNVVVLDGWTKLDIPSSRVLEEAIKSDLQTAVVMGYDKEGQLYFASTIGNLGDVCWLMELSKQLMLRVSEEQ